MSQRKTNDKMQTHMGINVSISTITEKLIILWTLVTGRFVLEISELFIIFVGGKKRALIEFFNHYLLTLGQVLQINFISRFKWLMVMAFPYMSFILILVYEAIVYVVLTTVWNE